MEMKSFILLKEILIMIKNGKRFDLYLDGRYVYTTNEIIDDFKNLPIYEEEKK